MRQLVRRHLKLSQAQIGCLYRSHDGKGYDFLRFSERTLQAIAGMA